MSLTSNPPLNSLVKSLDALSTGVNQSTLQNRSLPKPQPTTEIPARVGVGKPV